MRRRSHFARYHAQGRNFPFTRVLAAPAGGFCPTPSAFRRVATSCHMTNPNFLLLLVSRRCWPLNHLPGFALGGAAEGRHDWGVGCAAKDFPELLVFLRKWLGRWCKSAAQLHFTPPRISDNFLAIGVAIAHICAGDNRQIHGGLRGAGVVGQCLAGSCGTGIKCCLACGACCRRALV